MPQRAVLAAILAFVLVDLAFLGTRPVVSPDETRYGSIAAQMLESGQWLNLRMSGFRFHEKPPLDYWMTAASIWAFGQNAFAIRLPAALCTGMGALAFAFAVRRAGLRAGQQRGDATTTGAIAALAYLTMVLPTVGASVAILDGPLAGFVTVSCATFFLAATEPTERRARRLGWLVAAGVAAGLGFMTKGLPAIVLPAAAIAPWMAWEGRWRDMLAMAWVPLAVSAAVVAPWGIAVHQIEPGFWERFIVHEHLRRFVGGIDNQPSEPWAFYLLVVPLGMLPWVLNVPRVARYVPALLRTDMGARFALCWVLGPLFVLSISSGKLPLYALPVMPPLAWLVVLALQRALETAQHAPRSRWRFVPGALLVVAGVVALALALAGEHSAPLLGQAWLTHPHMRAAVAAGALACWGILDWTAQSASNPAMVMVRMGLSPVAGLAMFGVLFPSALINDLATPGRSLAAHREALMNARMILADPKMCHATAWFLGRTDFLVRGSAEEFDNGLGLPEEASRRVPDLDAASRVRIERASGSVAVTLLDWELEADFALPLLAEASQRIDMRGWTLLLFDAAPTPTPAPTPAADAHAR